MCGIVAQYGLIDHEELEAMLERLAHRGPDDRGAVQVGDAWLGHRRLSIVDLSTGHQPLTTADGTIRFVGNGEIYNHAALREELGERDFQTTSDNEVALQLVAEHGVDALARLNGMYAFVLAGRDGAFLAARDPVGIKPLYWTPPVEDGEEAPVVFASEMHAFPEALQERVEPFPPGHAWTPEDGLLRYASAVPAGLGIVGPTTEDELGDELPADLLERTREVIVDAVERQMMGDVPVGVFLSGGLDSTLVAAIAQRWCERRGTQLKTFAVGTEGSPDLEFARVAAEHLGTEHHVITYTPAEAKESLPAVVRAIESFDPRLVHSAVPNFMLARMAAHQVKVVLTGEGADELFAGYEYMEQYADADELQAELRRTVASLHNLNLQRCDRVTMAHSLEARVPFLDQEVIRWALRIPALAKISGGEQPEKRLLREAFAGWVPHELLWRTKAEFGEGSGARDIFREVADCISDEELEAERDDVSPPLRTKEELFYFRIWREHLPHVSAERTLSRFAVA